MIPLLLLLLLLQNAIARKLGISLRAHAKRSSESIHLSGVATRRVLNPGKGRKEQEIVHKSSRHSTDVSRPKRRCRSRGKVGNILDIADSQKQSMAPLDESFQTVETISSRKGQTIELFTSAIEDQNEEDNKIEENQTNCRKWDLIEIPAIDPKEDTGEPIVNGDQDGESFSVENANELAIDPKEDMGEPIINDDTDDDMFSIAVANEVELALAEAEDPTLGTIQEAESPSNNIDREREPREAEDPTLGRIQEAENPSSNVDQEREPRAEYEFHVALEMRTSSNDDDGGNDDDYRDLTNEDHRPASNDERTI